MKEFLQKLIALLVTEPVIATVQENTTSDLVTLDITSPSTEIGRLIGKNGNIIRSIRALLKLKGITSNKQVIVRLAEPTNPPV